MSNNQAAALGELGGDGAGEEVCTFLCALCSLGSFYINVFAYTHVDVCIYVYLRESNT